MSHASTVELPPVVDWQPACTGAASDFPGGSAAALYDSIQRLCAPPDQTRFFMCRDDTPAGRALAYETSPLLRNVTLPGGLIHFAVRGPGAFALDGRATPRSQA